MIVCRFDIHSLSNNSMRVLVIIKHQVTASLFAGLLISAFSVFAGPGFCAQDKKEDKKEEKKPEPFKIQKLTQGMGLYSIGPVSPDKKSILLIARKPDASPNLYVMNLGDHSIRPPLTSLKWGVADPVWSPDGQSVACLLYTSPSPRDRQKSRMPSSA